MILALLFLLYSSPARASWVFNFPVGWTEESVIAQPPHTRPITARYECTVFNFNRWSLPLEATTIYNSPKAFVTNAIAYYRNSKCKDTDGVGLDYLIILDPEKSRGVNVVDLKLEGLTVGGTPTSYQAVEFMHYAKIIYAKTGKAPRPGSVYVFGSRGAVTAWSDAPGTVRNVDMNEFTTKEGMDEIEKDPNEVALVLGMITEKVLNEDPGRKAKLKNWVQKKAGGQTAGANIPEMLERMAEHDAAMKAQADGYLGDMQGSGNLYGQQQAAFQMPSQPIGNANQRAERQSTSERNNAPRESMGPPIFPNRESSQQSTGAPIVTPYGMANRPIDLYQLAEECIKAGNSRAVWFQWYWAEYWFHARLAKAALSILDSVESGGLDAVKQMVEEEREVQEQRIAIENQLRWRLLQQRDAELKKIAKERANLVANLYLASRPQMAGAQEMVQNTEPVNGHLRVPNSINPREDEEIKTPLNFPEFFSPGQFSSSNALSGQTFNLGNFNQFSAGRLGMTVNQANDLAALRFTAPEQNPSESVTEMFRRAGLAGRDVPLMSSEIQDPVSDQPGEKDTYVVEDDETEPTKENPEKKLKTGP
ncbi:hypothetical protein TWF481_006318 [Arthrobotrys musiformis]|uniref:Uncharacterized protein n=1 Tax=Arthrobotrys musiformis TaxID=47236 RepID=A0AAV9WGF1_9PEZI